MKITSAIVAIDFCNRECVGMAEKRKFPKTSRKWLFTINHPEEHGFDHDTIKNNLSMIEHLSYWCMCDEIGNESGVYHTHIFIYRPTVIKFDYVKKLFPPAHIDPPFGSAKENRDYIGKFADDHHKAVDGSYDYIAKDGKHHAGINYGDTFEEYGELPVERQGQRNDLKGLYQLVKDGASDYQIMEENPNYLRYLNQITKVRDTLRYEEFKGKRRTDLKVEYWYGDPGTGKTSGVLNMYSDDKVYIVTDYNHPWDGYEGQDVVLFDDFDSLRIVTNDLLKWLDIYPLKLPARYSNKIACYTKVYITSNYSPEELWRDSYRWRQQEYKALMRRIHVIKRFYAGGRSEILQESDPQGFMKLSKMEMEQIDLMFGK